MRARVFAALVLALAGCDSTSGAGAPPCYQTLARVPLDWGASFLAIEGTTLYVGAFDDDAGYVDHFSIADISEPSKPQVLGTLTTDGLWGPIVMAAGRAYTGSGYVIDVTNPAAPTMLGQIPGWVAMAPLGPYFVQSHGDAITVVDLQNLAAPTTIGTMAGTSLRDMAVVGNTAYVIQTATSEALLIVDLTNPAAPMQIGSLQIPYADFVAANSDYAFVGAITGPLASADVQGMFVVDAQNRASPVVIGHAAERNWGPYALLSKTVLSVDNIIDVSNPTSPRIMGRPSFPPTSTGEHPSALTVTGAGTIGYWGTNAGVFVVDLSCPVAK